MEEVEEEEEEEEFLWEAPAATWEALEAPRLLFIGGAEDRRRGHRTNSVVDFSTNHKDTVCIEWSGRAPLTCSLHRRSRLELHRLEIEHLCDFHRHVTDWSDKVSPRS